MSTEYALSVWVAAHTQLLSEIATASGDPTLEVVDAAEAVLATVVLDKASAEVEINGDLTLPVLTQEASTTAGTAAFAVVSDGAGTAKLRMPCLQGTVPVTGALVINSLVFEADKSFELTAAVVKAGATL